MWFKFTLRRSQTKATWPPSSRSQHIFTNEQIITFDIFFSGGLENFSRMSQTPAAWFIRPIDLIVRRRGRAEIILTLSRLSFPHFATWYFALCYVTEIPCYASKNFFAKRFSSAADISNKCCCIITRPDRFVTPEAISFVLLEHR